MTGEELIAAERQRQINGESMTAMQDAGRNVEELEFAALAYMMAEDADADMPKGWPLRANLWKPKDRQRNLERAGALFLAAADLADQWDQRDKGAVGIRGASFRTRAKECGTAIDGLRGSLSGEMAA